MKQHTMFFIGVMLLLAISLAVVFCVLAIWIRKKFQFKSEETLPVLAKRLSVIPLTLNLVVLISLLCSFLLLSILPVLLVLLVFLAIILIAISLSIGTSIGLLGIVCSVVFTSRGEKGGVKYIIAASISTLISLVFLALYLFVFL